MSAKNTLSELAKLVAHTATIENRIMRTAGGGAALPAPVAKQQGVGDLIGTVMALASRTRRLTLPEAHIELDVFAPSGRRAVQLTTGRPQDASNGAA